MPFSPQIGLIFGTAGGDQRRRRRFPPAPPSLAVPPASPAGSEPAGEAIGGAPLSADHVRPQTRCDYMATRWSACGGLRRRCQTEEPRVNSGTPIPVCRLRFAFAPGSMPT